MQTFTLFFMNILSHNVADGQKKEEATERLKSEGRPFFAMVK